MNKEILAETFNTEAHELLDQAEKDLLQLEKFPDNKKLVDSIFRALHTIKGSGKMFGFTGIADFTHGFETLFENIRQNKVAINKEIITLSLSACDYIREMLVNGDIDKDLYNSKMDKFNNTLSRIQKTVFPEKKDKQQKEDKIHSLYRIQFIPDKNFFLTGSRILPLLIEVSKLGDHIIIPDTEIIPLIENFNPEEVYMKWTMIISTSKAINEIKDIFIFVYDPSSIQVEKLEYIDDDFRLVNHERVGDILLKKGDISQEKLNKILKDKKLFGQIAVDRKIVSKEKIDTALKEQEYVRKMKIKRNEKIKNSTIRVDFGKLNRLANLAGELVTLKAKYSQFSKSLVDTELSSLNEQLDNLTTELRKITMDIRMIPLSIIFNSFTRMVRDLSGNLDKKIELIIEGGETELDKNIIEKLKDPIMHIIRNSIDHGIEPPDTRKKLGKPETGRIILSAKHEGAHVYIIIKDDGSGLDCEKIRKTAIKKGLLQENVIIDDDQIFLYIFHPGFSTSLNTTDISGRGVGMDIVKQNIEKMKGAIEVTSEKGNGVEILLKIPLTLAIIEGLLVQTGNEKFILNLDVLDECYDFEDDLIVHSQQADMVKIGGEVVLFVRLNQLFKLKKNKKTFEQLIIINGKNGKFGIVVDSIIGKQQVVIKPIGPLFNSIKEISGSTILGDGSIALILDVHKIHRRIKALNRSNNSGGINNYE